MTFKKGMKLKLWTFGEVEVISGNITKDNRLFLRGQDNTEFFLSVEQIKDDLIEE